MYGNLSHKVAGLPIVLFITILMAVSTACGGGNNIPLPNGSLQSPTAPQLPGPGLPSMGPVSVAIASDSSHKFGKFVYVANRYGHSVSRYTIDTATGALTLTGKLATVGQPLWITVDPSARFAFVAGDSVSTYSIDASTGALMFTGAISSSAFADSVAVHPSGAFAYVTNLGGCSALGSGNVSMYAISPSNGSLSSIGTIGAGVCPWSAVVDPSGKFAYVANRGDCDSPTGIGSVSMYRINTADGSLTTIGTIEAGACAFSVTIDPSGRFLYVASEGSPVSMYSIDATTGALASIGTVASGADSQSVAVDPTGRFVYVANAESNDISIYTVNDMTGALTSIGRMAAESSPSSIAIDPSGKFLYLANFASDNLSTYSINATNGALTLIRTVST